MPLPQTTRRHNNGLVITTHRFGLGGPIGYDSNAQFAPAIERTFTSVREAETDADERVQRSGHHCDGYCSQWMSASVSVYFFEKFDIAAGVHVTSNCAATLSAIERVLGTALIQTEHKVDVRDLDGNEFVRSGRPQT